MTSTTTQRGTDRRPTPTSGAWVTDGKKPSSRLLAKTRRRSIPHLLLGVLLVLSCAAVFLVMSLTSGQRQPVLALARPVSIGQRLSGQDLKQVNVAVDPGVSVVQASQAGNVVGRTMSGSLPAGALLTFDAVTGTNIPATGQALTALSLKTGQFPPEVSTGTHVWVVFVAGAGTALPSPPTPEAMTVWPAVVTSVTSPPNQEITVVSVQLAQGAARQVAAVPAGQLSIVMLPGGDQ